MRFNPLTYVLIVAFFILLNYTLQKLAEWQKRQQGVQGPPEADRQTKTEDRNEAREELAEARKQTHEALAGTQDRPERSRSDTRRRMETEIRQRADKRRERVEPLLQSSSISERGIRVKTLLAGRDNLRQAVVMAVVLGPCRAEQPHDVR